MVIWPTKAASLAEPMAVADAATREELIKSLAGAVRASLAFKLRGGEDEISKGLHLLDFIPSGVRTY